MLAAVTPAQLCEARDALPDAGSDTIAGTLPSAAERAAYAALLRASADAAADAHPAPEAVFAALPPRELQAVLAALARGAPHALRALLLERLSPLAAELLTRRFEAADAERGGSAASDGAGGFYGPFFAAFPDGELLLSRLLDLKDALAAQALRAVVTGVLQPSGAG